MMIKSLHAFVVLLSIAALPSRAAGGEAIDDLYSPRAKFSLCVEAVKELDRKEFDRTSSSLCLGWIDGFRFGFSAASGELRKQVFACPPALANDSFIRIFVRGMQDNPELFSQNIFEAFQVIWQKKFPCPEK